MKIGFFGGSFNPPTNAHIAFAKSAIKECNLDKVIFVPMGDCYEKPNLAKAKDRLKMLEIALSNLPNMEISDIEVNQNKNITAIEAFRLIEKEYPNDEKYFLVGADNFIKLSNCNENTELKKYNYIIFEREDIEIIEDIKEFFNVKILENKEYRNKSATMFRNLPKEELINQDIVPREVCNYIIENKLY